MFKNGQYYPCLSDKWEAIGGEPLSSKYRIAISAVCGCGCGEYIRHNNGERFESKEEALEYVKERQEEYRALTGEVKKKKKKKKLKKRIKRTLKYLQSHYDFCPSAYSCKTAIKILKGESK